MSRQTMGNWVVSGVNDDLLLISPVIEGVTQQHAGVTVRLVREGKTAIVDTRMYHDNPLTRAVQFNIKEK